VCLDKTGTLSSENLEYDGLDLCRSEQPELVAAPPDSASSVAVVMRTCHGLATIGEVLVGNSVDRQMFGATGSTLDDGEGFRMRPGLHTAFALVTSPGAFGASSEFAIFRRFDFDPAYQRSSSIYKDLAGESWGVSVKGSAEAVAKVCRPDSVSKNIQDTYAYYARHVSTDGCSRVLFLGGRFWLTIQIKKKIMVVLNFFFYFFLFFIFFFPQGWYVLALAHRKLDPAEYENEAFQRLDRFAVERDLEFCGLLLLQNHLKENSKAVIEDLANTDTRAIMVTGDSAWNAIHVSRQAGLISSEAKVMLVQLERGSEIVIREVDGKMEVPSLRDLVQMHQAGSCEIAITGNALLHLAKNVNGTAAPMDVTEDENDFTTKLVDWILTDGCRIFARVAPDQKTWIVKQLIRLNYQVAHVGDGTNGKFLLWIRSFPFPHSHLGF
jgi:cation-transporting ATPase 13A3/4/5